MSEATWTRPWLQYRAGRGRRRRASSYLTVLVCMTLIGNISQTSCSKKCPYDVRRTLYTRFSYHVKWIRWGLSVILCSIGSTSSVILNIYVSLAPTAHYN
ncbi:hypothetical protein F4819DRAFT_323175 [Hypoxylon fuscum]|nr:hypothetical protein F4819DRAFT_323175 [Hypoxylon fuscum]